MSPDNETKLIDAIVNVLKKLWILLDKAEKKLDQE